MDNPEEIIVFKVVHSENGTLTSICVEGFYKRRYALNKWTRQRPFQGALLAFDTEEAAQQFIHRNYDSRRIFKAQAIRGKEFQLIDPCFNWSLKDKTDWIEPPDGTVFCQAIKLIEEMYPD